MKYLLVLLVFWPSIVFSERGVSDLGLCHEKYDFRNFISQFRNTPIITTRLLDNTFNARGCPNLTRLMRESKPITLAAHIINGPGLRNKRLERHEIHYGETIQSLDSKIRANDAAFLGKFDSRLHKLKALITRPIGLLISPCLECDLSDESRKKLLERTKNILPEATLIDNPLNARCLPGYKCEKHGSGAKGDVVDLDGEDADGVDVYDYGKRNQGKLTFTWKGCNNGLKKDEDWKPPTQRTNFCGSRDATDFGYFTRNEALDLSQFDAADEKGCRKFYSPKDGWKKGFTWKLGDGRSYGVALLPFSFKQVPKKVWLSKGGRRIDTGSFRGKYHDGRFIIDFTKHTANLPNSTVMHLDNGCYRLMKPQFRED